jgi:hypothetical protein
VSFRQNQKEDFAVEEEVFFRWADRWDLKQAELGVRAAAVIRSPSIAEPFYRLKKQYVGRGVRSFDLAREMRQGVG